MDLTRSERENLRRRKIIIFGPNYHLLAFIFFSKSSDCVSFSLKGQFLPPLLVPKIITEEGEKKIEHREKEKERKNSSS